MTKLHEGDRVRVKERPATHDDMKAGNYFNYYAGLTGSIQKVFNENEIVIDVDLAVLPAEVLARHEDIRNKMRDKWLKGLSEEARSKLTHAEKEFQLRYTILVGQQDLELLEKPTGTPAKSDTKADVRPTTSDIDRVEQEYLKNIASKREQPRS